MRPVLDVGHDGVDRVAVAALRMLGPRGDAARELARLHLVQLDGPVDQAEDLLLVDGDTMAKDPARSHLRPPGTPTTCQPRGPACIGSRTVPRAVHACRSLFIGSPPSLLESTTAPTAVAERQAVKLGHNSSCGHSLQESRGCRQTARSGTTPDSGRRRSGRGPRAWRRPGRGRGRDVLVTPARRSRGVQGRPSEPAGVRHRWCDAEQRRRLCSLQRRTDGGTGAPSHRGRPGEGNGS